MVVWRRQVPHQRNLHAAPHHSSAAVNVAFFHLRAYCPGSLRNRSNVRSEVSRSSGWVSSAHGFPINSCSEYPTIRQNAALTCMKRPSSPLTQMPNGAYSKTSRNRSSLAPQLPLGPQARADVAAMAEAPTISPADSRIGEIDSETSIARPSLCLADRVEGTDGAPVHEGPEVLAHRRGPVGRNENGDVLSDDFLAGVPKSSSAPRFQLTTVPSTLTR